MIKYATTLLFQFLLRALFAQSEATFTVKASHEIFVSPDIDTLQSDTTYKLKISGRGVKKIADIKFTGGTILVTDSITALRVFKITSRAQKHTLTFFSKKDKLLDEIISRSFTVLPISENTSLFGTNSPSTKLPVNFRWLRFRGYSGSDTISIESFLKADKSVFASHPYANPAENRIAFFKLTFNTKGTKKTLVSINGQFTSEMVKELQEVEPEEQIVLSEVRCRGIKEFPDDVILGPYKIHLQ